eukprot:Skav202041  [mRNA]  locus=scaffold1138:303324:303770:- [translate_table: standard]
MIRHMGVALANSGAAAEAMIVSIPLHQVKMTIKQFIFSRLLREIFLVLEVLPEDHHHHRHHRPCRVRKLPWFYWLYKEQTEMDSEGSEEALIDRKVSDECLDELRKGLANGKIYHASVVATVESHPLKIQALFELRLEVLESVLHPVW